MSLVSTPRSARAAKGGRGSIQQHTLALFHAMPFAQLQVSEISYSAAISASEKGWQRQQAVGLCYAIQANAMSCTAVVS